MFSLKRVWITFFFLSVRVVDLRVTGRALDLLSAGHRPLRTAAAEGRCAELTVPWQENVDIAPGDNGTVLQIHFRPFPAGGPGQVFPGKPLFSLIRRVYRCCQERVNCRSVKGIQGRLRAGRDVDFVFTSDVFSLMVGGAELHVHLSNPQGLDIHPILPFTIKNNLPTRFSVQTWGAVLELRVDLLFLVQSLQEAAGSTGHAPSLANIRQTSFFSQGHPPKDNPSSGVQVETSGVPFPAVDLGLVLGCTRGESRLPCGSNGVQLLHSPFIALYYR